jgi:glucose/arabinose dehydrogenase
MRAMIASPLLASGLLAAGLALCPADAKAQGAHDGSAASPLTGSAAYGDWHKDAPGVWRRITPADLPAPYANRSASNTPSVVARPANAALKLPPGFSVQQFLGGLEGPRFMIAAPNGDIFVAESQAGRIRVLRAPDGAAKPTENAVFAADLDAPFGIAFYPPGAEPQWVYIAETNAVLRFAYRNGDLKARGRPETIVKKLTDSSGGHWTRDVIFSKDGRRMFVSVGSASNAAAEMAARSLDDILRGKPADNIQKWEATHALGAGWAAEEHRADVLLFDPDGGNERIFATGIRNCVGMAIEPRTGELWCSTNERDGLGDNLPPDYATRVREGALYGWPWYYIGDHEDPRHKGERPDLRGKAVIPDLLIQPHSAPLEIAFYDPAAAAAAAFPADYRGDAFVALHGSWNRDKRTGYKIIRIRLKDGVPTGAYEDFLTGFVVDDGNVWGRPVGVAVAHDGALLVSEDGNGTIWRIAYSGKQADAH